MGGKKKGVGNWELGVGGKKKGVGNWGLGKKRVGRWEGRRELGRSTTSVNIQGWVSVSETQQQQGLCWVSDFNL
uniref:Uncharacterized protein n=1 Tax=Desertifilum tharense IPPAS B-1220 TaxID=1781255 RepID=A0A1E5QQU1_9CYAN|nr:hypothetical protein BH720_00860 [Desertifilum tharense IPPAS B-1220]